MKKEILGAIWYWFLALFFWFFETETLETIKTHLVGLFQKIMFWKTFFFFGTRDCILCCLKQTKLLSLNPSRPKRSSSSSDVPLLHDPSTLPQVFLPSSSPLSPHSFSHCMWISLSFDFCYRFWVLVNMCHKCYLLFDVAWLSLYFSFSELLHNCTPYVW